MGETGKIIPEYGGPLFLASARIQKTLHLNFNTLLLILFIFR